MREFLDEDGRVWRATIRSEDGMDYKGRHYLYLLPKGEGEEGGHGLSDVTLEQPPDRCQDVVHDVGRGVATAPPFGSRPGARIAGGRNVAS